MPTGDAASGPNRQRFLPAWTTTSMRREGRNTSEDPSVYEAKEKIAQPKKWVADFHATLDAGDAGTASELAGGTVRIADGMTGSGS